MIDNITINTQHNASSPEPAGMTLLGLGAAGLLGYGWKRRRAGSTAAA